jgi:hypothetical protein
MSPRATELDPSGKKIGVAIATNGKKVKFVIQDEVSVLEGQTKKIVFQRLVFTDDKEQYRLGYYVLGRSGDMKEKWVWARSAPMIFPEHFVQLVEQARAAGWYK